MTFKSWFDILPDEINDIIWRMVFSDTLNNIKKFGITKDEFINCHKTKSLQKCYNRYNINFVVGTPLPPDTPIWNRYNSLNDDLLNHINCYFGDHIKENDDYTEKLKIEHTVKYLNRKIINTTIRLFNLCKPINDNWESLHGSKLATKYTKSMFAGSISNQLYPFIHSLSIAELKRFCNENGIDTQDIPSGSNNEKHRALINKCLTL